MHDDGLAVDSGDTMISLLKLIQASPRLVPLISLLKPGGDTTVPPSEGLEIADNVDTGIALGFNGAVVNDIRNIYTASLLQEWSNGDCGLGRQLL